MILLMLFLMNAAHAFSPKCEALLGHTIARLTDEGVIFRHEGAVGPRGILATADLKPSAKAIAFARRQGVFYWGHGIGVRPSLEAARAHDRGLSGLNQLLYVIAPEGATRGLENTVTIEEDALAPGELVRRREAISARWLEITLAKAPRLVYFAEPEFDPDLHEYGPPEVGVRPLFVKGTSEPLPRRLIEIDPADAARLIHADEMQFVDNDPRGPMFYQWGWFFPHVRGILTAERLMTRNARGGLAFDTTKNALKLAERMVDDHWTFTVNTNFREVLDRARGVMHGRAALPAGEPPVPNSWLMDETMFQMMLAENRAGRAFSFELRDPGGHLAAATVGSFGRGQHVMTETSFALSEVKRDRMAHLKLIGIASTLWLSEIGYPEVDKQAVTGFTAEIKTVYEPARRVLEAGARPRPPQSPLKRHWRPPPWTSGVDGTRVYPHYGRLSTQRTGS